MRRECDVESLNDFTRYYHQGWIGLLAPDGSGKTLPLQLQTSDDGTLYFNTLEKIPGQYSPQLASNGKWQWDYIHAHATFSRPELGFVDHYGTVLYCSVVAERNTARGVRLDRMSYNIFNRWPLRNKLAGFLDIGPWAIHVVWQLFNRQFETLQSAYSLVQSGEKVGVPLAPNYALGAVPECPCPVLVYKRWIMGHMPDPYTIWIDSRYRDYQDDVIETFGIHTVVV